MHHERHPPLDVANSLPDGLYKGKLKLEKHILPSLDWAGLSVKVSRSGFQPSIRIADYSSSILFKSQFFLVKMNFVPGSRYAYYGPLEDGPQKAFVNSKDSFTLFIPISISTWKLLPNRPPHMLVFALCVRSIVTVIQCNMITDTISLDVKDRDASIAYIYHTLCSTV
jgi:hypothetical protein